MGQGGRAERHTHTGTYGWSTTHFTCSQHQSKYLMCFFTISHACEDSRQSWIVLLLCSHHWLQPAHCHTLCLLPLLKDSLLALTPPALPLPIPPLIVSLPTPAPCPQCSVRQRRWSPSDHVPTIARTSIPMVALEEGEVGQEEERQWQSLSAHTALDKMTLTVCSDNPTTECVHHVSIVLPYPTATGLT